MCCFSMCGQIVYGLLMLACLALTCVALFTSSELDQMRNHTIPGWSDAKSMSHLNGQDYSGLMPWNCVGHSNGGTCKDWWANTPGWQHATVILMIIALIVELVALAWNIVTFFACCCKKYIIHPLTLFALVITICLTAALIVYGVNNKDLFRNTNQYQTIDTALGWSFWIGVGAAVVALADVVVGAMTVCLGESGL